MPAPRSPAPPAPLHDDDWPHWFDHETWDRSEFLALLSQHDPRGSGYDRMQSMYLLQSWRTEHLSHEQRQAADIVLASEYRLKYPPRSWFGWVASKASVVIPQGMRREAERRWPEMFAARGPATEAPTGDAHAAGAPAAAHKPRSRSGAARRVPEAQVSSDYEERWERGEFPNFVALETEMVERYGVGRSTAQGYRARMGIAKNGAREWPGKIDGRARPAGA